METLVLERNGRLFLASDARLVDPSESPAEDLAARTGTDFSADEWSSPFIKWIAGNFVESDSPNSNNQFWTADDLAMGEYSIKYAPLNMVHKTRQPVGFFASTNTVPLESGDAAAERSPLRIEALAGMWTHIFPFESALVDAASEKGLLYFSMECRGTHIICAGDQGCGQRFEYLKSDTHCAHLKERASVRHIVNPTFRGGALIVPPVRPGWSGAHASVLSDAVKQEAAKFAEQTEHVYEAARQDGRDITASAWEHTMASIIALAD